jgi:hypothetical protein
MSNPLKTDSLTQSELDLILPKKTTESLIFEDILSFRHSSSNKTYHHKKNLHPCILNNHYELAARLLKDGYDDPHQVVKSKSIQTFNMVLNDLGQQMTEYTKNPQLESISAIENTLDAILLFANKSGNFCYTKDLTDNALFDNTAYPLTMILKVYASLAPSELLIGKINQVIQAISNIDNSESIYMSAKELLQAFPTGNAYPLKISEHDAIWFHSEGNFGLFSTDSARKSLAAYIDILNNSDVSSLQLDIFKSAHKIFEQSYEFCTKRLLPETFELAENLYHEGKTILLPTGWTNHFAEVILSKHQKLYIDTNCSEFTEQENKVYGDTCHTLQQPDTLKADFFASILTNTSQDFLTSDIFDLYNISKTQDVLPRTSQQYGNCAWKSLCDAVEGVMYIELLNRHVDVSQAKSLAKNFSSEWESFHLQQTIDNFMNNQPGLPLDALIDIFCELQTNENHSHSKEYFSNKIFEAITSEHYADELHRFMQPYTISEETHSFSACETPLLASCAHLPEIIISPIIEPVLA